MTKKGKEAKRRKSDFFSCVPKGNTSFFFDGRGGKGRGKSDRSGEKREKKVCRLMVFL